MAKVLMSRAATSATTSTTNHSTRARRCSTRLLASSWLAGPLPGAPPGASPAVGGTPGARWSPLGLLTCTAYRPPAVDRQSASSRLLGHPLRSRDHLGIGPGPQEQALQPGFGTGPQPYPEHPAPPVLDPLVRVALHYPGRSGGQVQHHHRVLRPGRVGPGRQDA